MARSGTRFVVPARNGAKDSCETFYFAGANAYYLVCPSDHVQAVNLVPQLIGFYCMYPAYNSPAVHQSAAWRCLHMTE